MAQKGMPIIAEPGAQTQVGRGTWKPAEFHLISRESISEEDDKKKEAKKKLKANQSKSNVFFLKTHRGYYIGILLFYVDSFESSLLLCYIRLFHHTLPCNRPQGRSVGASDSEFEERRS